MQQRFSALAGNPPLAETFVKLAYSQQKEVIDWLVAAKKPETRARRVQKTLEMVAANKRPKG